MSNPTPTPQQQLRVTLESAGIPYKEIKCFGSQVIVTAYSEVAARKWARLIAHFAKVKGPVKSIDYNKDNRDTNLNPTVHDVWLVGGTI